MNELALFAGAGGGILGGKLLGWRTVCAVECEVYPTLILAQRQNDGHLEPFPIWDDVRTFDGRPWRGIVDVVSGGFPCQDISAAGKGAGITGERSGLWTEMARIIGEVRPRYAFVENSPMLISRGLTRVLSDLAEMGYDARWGIIGAHHVGAPHKRDRIWILATNTNLLAGSTEQEREHQRAEKPAGSGPQWLDAGADVADTNDPGQYPSQGQGQARDNSGRCCADVADTNGGRCEQRDAHKWTISEPNAAGTDIPDSVRDGSQRQREDGATKRQAGLCGREGCNEEQYISDTKDERILRRERSSGDGIPNTEESRLEGEITAGQLWKHNRLSAERCTWWTTEPDVGRVAHGVAARVDRLKAIGNGQVPAVASLAWEILTQETQNETQ